MFPTLVGTVILAGIVGFAAEYFRFVRNGYVASIIIAVGGAFLFYFVRIMFHVGFGSPGLDAILSACGALILVPTRWRR